MSALVFLGIALVLSLIGCGRPVGARTARRGRWRPTSGPSTASSRPSSPEPPRPLAPTAGATPPPRPAVARRRPPAPRGRRLARDLAIDLGTANTLVYAKGRGIVLNEPTVIALNVQTHDVLAMGHQAWQMIGRTPGYIQAVRPLRQGAITDFEITQRMIRLLLQRAGLSRFQRPRVLLCVPSAITEVERRAVKEAARQAGRRRRPAGGPAHGRRHRRRPAHPRAPRATWSSTSAVARRRRP